MATHSSILAWRIPWTGEPGRLQSMVSQSQIRPKRLGTWLDLLEVQGTLKSLPQHHSSKASVLWISAFSIVQLSQPYMTTRKAIALTRQTFVGKVCLRFLTCCLFVIAFLPRSTCLLDRIIYTYIDYSSLELIYVFC